MNVVIIGAGAMGAALTFPLAASGHTPIVCGTPHDSEILKKLRAGKEHPRIHKRLPKPTRLIETDQIAGALREADFAILAVNTQGLLPALQTAYPHLDEGLPLITVAKGFIEIDGKPQPVASAVRTYLEGESVPKNPPLACLIGPSIAEEIANGVPTLVELASENAENGRHLAEALSSSNFNCRFSTDLHGVETCAAYKNVYTIALAWTSGMSRSEGSSGHTDLKAILFLQTILEIQSLIRAGNGNPKTALGIAGLGDLVATADAGRNGRFGRLLGSGKSVDEAVEAMEKSGVTTIEGLQSARHGLRYARNLSISMEDRLPLLHAVHRVLHDGESVRDVISSLDLSQMAKMENSA